MKVIKAPFLITLLASTIGIQTMMPDPYVDNDTIFSINLTREEEIKKALDTALNMTPEQNTLHVNQLLTTNAKDLTFLKTPTFVSKIPLDDYQKEIHISPNHEFVLNHFNLYQTTTGKHLGTLEKDHLNNSWLHSKKTIITNDNKKIVKHIEYPHNSIYVWNAQSQKLLHTFCTNKQHNHCISNFDISPDSTMLALSASQDNTVDIYDLENGHKTHTLTTSNNPSVYIDKLQFSPNSALLNVTQRILNNYLQQFWHIDTQKLITFYTGQYTAFSPSDTYIAIADGNNKKIITTHDFVVKQEFTNTDWENELTFSPSEQFLISKKSVCDIDNKTAFTIANNHIIDDKSKINPSGKYLFQPKDTADTNKAALINTITQEKITIPIPDHGLYSIDFDPSDNLIILNERSPSSVWDTKSGAHIIDLEDNYAPSSIQKKSSFSSDGTFLITYPEKDTAVLYKTENNPEQKFSYAALFALLTIKNQYAAGQSFSSSACLLLNSNSYWQAILNTYFPRLSEEQYANLININHTETVTKSPKTFFGANLVDDKNAYIIITKKHNKLENRSLSASKHDRSKVYSQDHSNYITLDNSFAKALYYAFVQKLRAGQIRETVIKRHNDIN